MGAREGCMDSVCTDCKGRKVIELAISTVSCERCRGTGVEPETLGRPDAVGDVPVEHKTRTVWRTVQDSMGRCLRVKTIEPVFDDIDFARAELATLRDYQLAV